MLDARLEHPTDLAGWRTHARACIARGIAPEAIAWRVGGAPPDLFTSAAAGARPGDAPALIVPRRFITLARCVICHRQPARLALLYRLLWRITGGERRLLDIAADADVRRAQAMAQSVRRDSHKMQAFVRFRSTRIDGAERFLAWFVPQHFIVERVGPLFARRFAGMPWSILTPDRSAHWDGAHLTFDRGTDRLDMPSEDALAAVWLRYYAGTFNPARVNLKAMQAQMPRRYWQDLPEARLIASLARSAGASPPAMAVAPPPPASAPSSPALPATSPSPPALPATSPSSSASAATSPSSLAPAAPASATNQSRAIAARLSPVGGVGSGGEAPDDDRCTIPKCGIL